MASQHEVSVHYRHIELQPAATLRDADGGELFLELAEPPPVRTVLELREGATSKAFEVVAVVEVEAPGTPRGCRVREIDGAALRDRKVGSERLADASAGAATGGAAPPPTRVESSDDGENWSDDYGAHMAVPAPVIDPDGSDESEAIDINADGSEDADDDGNASAGEASDASDSTESSRQGKKRRGRKRK
jgi:hypothetical protein